MVPLRARLLLVLVLAPVAAGGGLEHRDGGGGAAAHPDLVGWTFRSVRELIDVLPDVELSYWDAEVGSRTVVHPAVKELRRRLDGGLVLSQEEGLRALLGSGAIRWRSTWPAGEPFAISLRQPPWISHSRLRVLPRGGILREATVGLAAPMCGFSHDLDRARALHRELGLLSPGQHRLVLDVSIEGHSPLGLCGPPAVLWQGELTIEVEVVLELDAVLPPRSDPELHAPLRSLVRLRRTERTNHDGLLYLAGDPGPREILACLALPLQVELWHRDRLVASYPPARPENGKGELRSPELPPEGHRLAYLRALPFRREDPGPWTVRLRAVDESALTWWGATARFTGVVEIPLAELVH